MASIKDGHEAVEQRSDTGKPQIVSCECIGANASKTPKGLLHDKAIKPSVAL
jgi:hypothetical protein